jgi:hypothetical protein
MQLAERRIEATRIEVARPLEVVGPRGDDIAVGYTRNLSETGVRARFDGRCTVGANLLVRIALEDGAPPVEKRARVVWTAPDVYGDGTDVGLRLLTAEEECEDVPMIGAPPVIPVIVVGAEVEIECGGIALPATVTRIGDLTDGGTIQVTLALFEGAPAREDDEDPVVEKAPVIVTAQRYVAAARRSWIRFGLPFATKAKIALAVISRWAGILVARAASRLWARLPERVTAPVERAWKIAALPRRAVGVWSTLAAARKALSSRLHAAHD